MIRAAVIVGAWTLALAALGIYLWGAFHLGVGLG